MFVREFSAAGPCITLGVLLKRTATQVIYRDRNGKVKRRGGYALEHDLIHTEPCTSCRDHAQTQFPNGYME